MKLITVDLDGTLLAEDSTISEENITAIHQAQKAGHIVAVSTGRSVDDVQEILRKAGLECPITAGNGGKSYDGGHLMEELLLSEYTVQETIQQLEENQMYYELFTQDGLLMDKSKMEFLNEEIEQYYGEAEKNANWTANIMETQLEQHGIVPISDFNRLDLSHYDVYKIMIICFDLEKLAYLRKELSTKTDLSLTTSGNEKLEISHAAANKGNSLKMMVDYFTIPLENTVAIGDSMNDYPMFQAAEMSIAMANAREQLKEISTYLTKSNTENGVAHAIKKYILRD